MRLSFLVIEIYWETQKIGYNNRKAQKHNFYGKRNTNSIAKITEMHQTHQKTTSKPKTMLV